MTKLKLKQRNFEYDVIDACEKEIKPYGKEGAHITVPKKHLGKIAIVGILKDIKTEKGGAMSMWGVYANTKGTDSQKRVAVEKTVKKWEKEGWED